MTSDLFVDTSGWGHQLVALLQNPLRVPRHTLFQVVDGIRTSPHVQILHVDAALDDQGWKLLKQRPDKEWSLVDAVSFVAMHQWGILEALTTDHHFEQAGYVRLLK
jgi:uncharacterized protein